MDDITDFLPKYPNIVQNFHNVLNPYESKNFYENIYYKKEFYDERLDKTEDFPKELGGLLKHQKIIARFLSSHTIYDQLLLVHSMGTGKACASIGAIEQIKYDGGFKGALYLAKGDALLNNFMNELIFKCTDGRYIPENYNKLTKLEQIQRKKKSVKEYYNFNTFETFAKYIKNSSIDKIRKDYNNYIIVIDEVHNLRIQDKISGLNTYEQFFKFLHYVEGCKILLMTGTPMKDNVKEISSVMNLILPLKSDGESYLPVGNDFIKEYFNETNNIYKIKSDKIDNLKSSFKGRVSFLNPIESNVTKIFKGKTMGTLKHFKVIPDIMSDFQTKVYEKAYNLDKEGDKEGIYSNSRQAILFVYPDESFGKEGFDKYVKKNRIGKTSINNQNISFSLSNELKDALKGDTDEKILEKLNKFSSKYTESIRTVLRAKKEGKCVFIYNEFVYGSGLILFGLILELFGFVKATGKEIQNDDHPRYASLTNVTSTDSQITDIVNRFNKKDNVRGKIINIIMGSRKISEGFSFQNIIIEDIQTPWFNYSETSQAIARGIRFGSHYFLIESGVQNPIVEIYQRVSININSNNSVDLEMYQLSEDKDISIKGVERIIKESAFDCALTYKRNLILGKNYERDCDYMDCNYKCDDISDELLLNSEISNDILDYSTFQLYYNDKNIQSIITIIKDIFRKEFSMDLNTIKQSFDQKYTDFEVISALRKIINNNIVIINKYGFVSYIKEANNIYFLIDNLSLKGKNYSEYYTQNPHIHINNTFANILNPIYYKYLPNTVQQLFNSTDLSEIKRLIFKLPSEIIEYIIEQCLISKKLGLIVNKTSRDLLLYNFSNFYTEIDGVLVSSFLYEENETLKYLIDNKWVECDEEYKEKYLEFQKQNNNNMENSKYGYYGQLNPEDDKFCIRNVSTDTSKAKEKKHKITSGQVCSTWKLQELFDIAINKLKIPLPEDQEKVKKYLENMVKKKRNINKKLPQLFEEKEENKEDLWKLIKEFKIINNMFNDVKNDLSCNDMLRILYWGTKTKEELCLDIQDFFRKEKLLQIDNGCGKGDKKKK